MIFGRKKYTHFLLVTSNFFLKKNFKLNLITKRHFDLSHLDAIFFYWKISFLFSKLKGKEANGSFIKFVDIFNGLI